MSCFHNKDIVGVCSICAQSLDEYYHPKTLADENAELKAKCQDLENAGKFIAEQYDAALKNALWDRDQLRGLLKEAESALKIWNDPALVCAEFEMGCACTWDGKEWGYCDGHKITLKVLAKLGKEIG